MGDAAAHRLSLVEGLYATLSDRRAPKTRALDLARSVLPIDAPGDDAEAVRRVCAALHVEMRKLREAGVKATTASPAKQASATPKAHAKSRTGGAAKDAEFEKAHPRAAKGRVGGGQWILKRGVGYGDAGPEPSVQDLQKRLGELGLRVLPDGQFGPVTEEAVKTFQTKYGLEPTGVVNAATTETLRNPPPKTAQEVEKELREQEKGSSRSSGGSKGSKDEKSPDGYIGAGKGSEAEVKAAQEALDAAGFDLGATGVDGVWGDSTAEAVKALQRMYGLKATGEMGPLERRLLEQLQEELAQGRVAQEGLIVTYALTDLILSEVASASLPDMDESPGKNWVERAGGLPSYIDRIARHLRHEKGMTQSRAIAVAINAAKRMCGSGDTNFPGAQQVNAKSRAQACKAVAQWEKMKAATKLKEADVVEVAEMSDEDFAAVLGYVVSMQEAEPEGEVERLRERLRETVARRKAAAAVSDTEEFSAALAVEEVLRETLREAERRTR